MSPTREEDSPRLDALAPPAGWEAGVARGVEAAIRDRASEGFVDALGRSGRWLLPIAAAVVLVLWIANAAKARDASSSRATAVLLGSDLELLEGDDR